jgi:hypothetical protein
MTTPTDSTPASPVRLPASSTGASTPKASRSAVPSKGAGPPLLLLHGYPQNHLIWRHVAPALARDYTVVLADLRGYGDSGKPAPDAAGLAYSKRAMGGDLVGLMRRLGFAQWGKQSFVGRGYEPLSIRQQYAVPASRTMLAGHNRRPGHTGRSGGHRADGRAQWASALSSARRICWYSRLPVVGSRSSGIW